METIQRKIVPGLIIFINIAKKYFFLVLILLIPLFFSYGETNYKFEYAFDIGGEPGFPIIKDRDGFLWFTSFYNGLVRFDGSDRKLVRLGDYGISNDFVTQVFEDNKGNIWAGTNNGLNQYNKKTNTITTFYKDQQNPQSSLAGNVFNLASKTIIQDRTGKMWFGTQSGLSRYNEADESFKNYLYDEENSNTISGNDIYCVFEDSNGLIWVSTKNQGVNSFNPSSGLFTRFIHDPEDKYSLPDNAVRSIIEDNDGNLWFATYDKGLIRRDPATGKFIHFQHDPDIPEGLPQMTIQDLILLSNGEIALISGNSAVGLIILNPKDFTYQHITSTPGDLFTLSTNAVHGLFEEEDGTIWIVHNNGKVDKADPKEHRFDLYQNNPLNEKSIASNAAMPIYEDRFGQIWVGLFGSGLELYIPESNDFIHFVPDTKDPKTIPHGYPSGFFESSSGDFYVSTIAGMVLFDPIKHEVIKKITEDTMFYTMIEDHIDPDVIWAIGWEQSLNRLNLETGEHKIFRHDPNDPTSFSAITALRFIRDSDDPNFFWIATWGGGLEKFNQSTGKFTHFQNETINNESISSNTVYDVLVDSFGNFWVTTDQGLNKFNKKEGTFKRFGREQGFDAKIVHNVLEDKSGHLWMGTNVGLVVFDISTEKVVKIYTEEDGLHSHDFFTTARGQTSDGQMWFGGFNGLNRFDPENMEGNLNPPQIYLTSIKQNGIEINPPSAFEYLQEIELDWQNNSFEFEYAALNYTSSIKNQYRYKLEGYDRSWFDSKNKKFGRYAGLPGGTYTLLIKGSNNDGVWNLPEQEVSLKVIVLYPPWKRWWAYLLYFFSGGLIIYSLINLRLRSSEHQKDLLQKRVDIRTSELENVNVQLIEAKQLAEEATKAKSDFLASMSHEIRTPMNAIIGLGSLLGKTDLNSRQQDYVEKIRRSAANLLGIINDILDFSKIEAGKMDMEETNFKLNDVLQNLFGMIGIKAYDKGIELISYQDKDVPLDLVGDPLRLGQILLNLANNAIKFTEEGEIEISTKLIQRDSESIMLLFEVRDTGIGLKTEHQKKLFKSFSQVDTSITRKYGGTGLGLTISKHLSEMMGGEIGVKSEIGKGSTFFFTVKLKIGEEKETLIIPKDLTGSWVLVVDDNTTALDVLRSYLEDFSFNVTTVTSGELAIRELIQARASQGKKYDLILMDYQMPGLNGIEASLKIRKSLENVEVPKIVMVTSFGREEILAQVHKAKLDGFLIKPVSPSMLLDTIMHVFDRNSSFVKQNKEIEMRPEGFDEIIGAKILLVEDNEINQQVAMETLEQEGFRVDVANNGLEAVKMMNTDYDVVLMDIQMPVMDGFEATREIRNDDQYKDIAIIAMTADAMTGVREKVLEAGMSDYITKPINHEELWKVLVKWIKPGKREIPEGSIKTMKEDDDSIIIPDIKGLNTKEGLTHVGGNKKLYLSLLTKFRDKYSNSVGEIRENLKNENREAAGRQAHTIKGVAGNIGAKTVQHTAAKVETAVKEEKENDGIINKLEEVLFEIIEALKQANLDVKKTFTHEKSKVEIDPKELKYILEELRPMLEKRRPKPAKDIIEKLSIYKLPVEITSEFEQLSKSLSKYDFKEAIKNHKLLLEILLEEK